MFLGGEYYYSANLFKTDQVIFIGNNTDSKIKGIEIRQFPDLWNEAQASSTALQAVKTSDYISLYSKLNNIEVTEETEIPETFTIPNLATGQENTKYIIRAK